MIGIIFECSKIFERIEKADHRLKKFEIYLDRHIELDGDVHSVLAKKLVATICKTDADWKLAEDWAVIAIKSRLEYWDRVAENIQKAKNKNLSFTHRMAQKFCSNCGTAL